MLTRLIDTSYQDSLYPEFELLSSGGENILKTFLNILNEKTLNCHLHENICRNNAFVSEHTFEMLGTEPQAGEMVLIFHLLN